MRRNSDYAGALQCENKTLKKRIAMYESGEEYQRIIHDKDRVIDEYARMNKRLKREIEDLHRALGRVWKNVSEAYEDRIKELEAEIKELKRRLKKEEELRFAAEHERDCEREKCKEARHQKYEAETELEEERGKNQKLRAQINRNYENSSIPSSQCKNRKKIANSREKTERKPGAQVGHSHHERKKQKPTQVIQLPIEESILEDPDYKKTSQEIVKQLIGIRVIVDVTEYHAPVYRNSKTGERTHAAFPSGVINDVNYDGSIRALLFLLNTDCAVSIDKSQKLLSDLTDGKLNISKGMINQLCQEFADKSEAERKKVFADLLLSPVLHTDCTNAKVNGKNAYVFICASPEGKALYVAREQKGHEGVKGTVTEDYQGVLVHDHDMTFYSYGSEHQECLAHVERYLKSSIENKPDRKWNVPMHALVKEMIHYRNEHAENSSLDPEKVAEFESRYHEILKIAKDEYEYEPPNEYYRDGYNLYRRMEEKSEEHLRFLHDLRVPPTNNTAERDLRDFKRKQTQVMSFRSFESLEAVCHSKSVLHLLRQKTENVYHAVVDIFNKEKEPDVLPAPSV